MIPLFCMQADRPAVLVRAATPELPPMALQQDIGGVVRVRVMLDATGSVRDAVIVSAPSGILKSESLRAARASTFAPARRRCANAASEYVFRVLYDPQRPVEPRVPRPTPSPSPTPAPPPNLAGPWQLQSSSSGSYGYLERTLSSSGAYSRVSDSFSQSNRIECRTTLEPAALERVTAVLRAAHAERWAPSYFVGTLPAPAPSPVAVPTSRPDVDVVAVVRGEVYRPRNADGPSSGLALAAGGRSYRTAFAYDFYPGDVQMPADVEALTRALDAADAECLRHRALRVMSAAPED